ncbi:MAG: 2OG-Fe(II) oxygenase [Caldimonas sp.]
MPETPASQIDRGPALQTDSCVVIDDFLPEQTYQEVYDWTERLDYRHINTTGSVNRVWSPNCGFPMCSVDHFTCNAPGAEGNDGIRRYPVQQSVDDFISALNGVLPRWAPVVGAGEPEGWHHYSVGAWVYPPNTALGMHGDGAGAYTGAFVYFLSPHWRVHWGGLLVVLDEQTNADIVRGGEDLDPFVYHGRRWLHASPRDDSVFERGIGHCILPKRNRLVLLRAGTYHLVTKVLPECGDNVRVSLGGFFHRGGW